MLLLCLPYSLSLFVCVSVLEKENIFPSYERSEGEGNTQFHRKIANGKTGLPFQKFHFFREFSSGTNRKIMFHLQPNRNFRNLLVNGKHPMCPGYDCYYYHHSYINGTGGITSLFRLNVVKECTPVSKNHALVRLNIIPVSLEITQVSLNNAPVALFTVRFHRWK